MTMQYDNDLESPHRELFLSVRDILLGIAGTEETKKEKKRLLLKQVNLKQHPQNKSSNRFKN